MAWRGSAATLFDVAREPLADPARAEALSPVRGSGTLAFMPVSNIPDGVRRFLLSAIPSVPHLEALLLLRGAPERAWSADAIAARLYVDPSVAAALLADLGQRGLAKACDQGVQFAPRDALLAGVVDELAGVYARHVVEVTELIHSSSDPKARRFADAFRLRKEP